MLIMQLFSFILLIFYSKCVSTEVNSTYKYDKYALENRKADHSIHPILLSRRSLRHFTNETIPHEELMSLFEAARWAPSSFNAQPWNFVYARRETKHWGKFFDLLLPSNQVWVKDAAAIGIVISSKYSVHHNKTSFNPTHEYDTGSAWMSLAIEGSARGLAVCGIGGFDYDRAAQVFNIKNETHKICAMFCVGKRDDQSTNETLSQREKIDKFVFEGDFVIF